MRWAGPTPALGAISRFRGNKRLANRPGGGKMTGMGLALALLGVVALSVAGGVIPFCRWLSERDQTQRSASEKLFWK